MTKKTTTKKPRRQARRWQLVRPEWLKGDGAATAALIATAFLSVIMISMAGLTFWESRLRLAPDYLRDRVARSAEFVTPGKSEELVNLFDLTNFDLALVREGRKSSPRIVIVRLPGDLPAFEPPEARKDLFLKLLLPSVLLANEEISLTRARILRLQKRRTSDLSLSTAQSAWLAAIAGRFGASEDGPPEFSRLLERVDVIPVALALAQGGIESGWGTARVALEGNALFGQRAWARDNAVDAPPEIDTLYRAYDNVLDAARSYALNLNTHEAYNGFRKRRLEMRKTGNPLDAASLAGQLLLYSERSQDYVDQIRTVIAVNKLTDFAQARLSQN